MYTGLIYIKNQSFVITMDHTELGLKPGEWYGVTPISETTLYKLTYIPVGPIMEKELGNLLTWQALQREWKNQLDGINLSRYIDRPQLQTCWLNNIIETVNVTNISEVLCTQVTS